MSRRLSQVYPLEVSALALAAQDTVKNLIGSALIFLDKPFQIGDYVLAGGHEGTVVEVGFRSTRLMQIDTSIIAIPNGSISNMPLTNPWCKGIQAAQYDDRRAL